MHPVLVTAWTGMLEHSTACDLNCMPADLYGTPSDLNPLSSILNFMPAVKSLMLADLNSLPAFKKLMPVVLNHMLVVKKLMPAGFNHRPVVKKLMHAGLNSMCAVLNPGRFHETPNAGSDARIQNCCTDLQHVLHDLNTFPGRNSM